MAGINDYSNTPSLNTTINTIDVDEGCNPANINDAIRQLMADIADVDDGVVPLQTPDINGGTIDGAVIGGTTAAAGTFTTVTATSFSGDGSGLTGISSDSDLIQDADNDTKIQTEETADEDKIRFDTAGVERVIIDNLGNVGIGTSSPGEKLTVSGNILVSASNPVLSVLDNSGETQTATAKIHGNRTGTGGAVTKLAMINSQGAGVGVETAEGSIQTWYQSSGVVNMRHYIGATEILRVDSAGVDVTGTLNVTGTLTIDGGAGFVDVTGNYGNFQVNGGGTTGGYDGLNVNGHTVFMSNGSRAGIYNDTNNEWLMYGDFNGDVALYFNGSAKLQTTSSGILVTGGVDMTATAGAVGTYATLRNMNTTTNTNPGTTRAGSTLNYCSLSGGNNGTAPSGTWRAMSYVQNSNVNVADAKSGLWFRIS